MHEYISGGPLPDNLQVVSIPILSNDECHKIYQKFDPILFSEGINDGLMCAGSGGRDSCQVIFCRYPSVWYPSDDFVVNDLMIHIHNVIV